MQIMQAEYGREAQLATRTLGVVDLIWLRVRLGYGPLVACHITVSPNAVTVCPSVSSNIIPS